jgi:hypothetical protein
MFEILLDLIADRFLVILSVAVLVYVVLFITVFGALVLAGRYAKGPFRYGLRPIRIRLSLWKLMAVILVCGALIDVVVVARRAIHASKKAENHAHKVSLYQLLQGRDKSWLGLWVGSFDGCWTPEQFEYLRTMERYHDRMREKYYDDARHPWRSASPEPLRPEPEFQTVFGPLEAE